MQKRADNRKFHYIYKITRDDGKYYIGMHSTDDMEDGYFGSGTRLSRSIKKHGKERHSKSVLEYFPSRSILKLREKGLITEELRADPMCMNIAPGGGGGKISDEMQKRWSSAGGQAIKKRFAEDAEFVALRVQQSAKNLKAAHQAGKIRYDTFIGRKHSEATLQKMRDTWAKKKLSK
jgi:hypothetical protein